MANKKPVSTKEERDNLINAILNKGTAKAANTGTEESRTPIYISGVFDAMHGPHYHQPKNIKPVSAEELMNLLEENDPVNPSLLREKTDLPELPVDTFSVGLDILPPSEVLEKMSASITVPNQPVTPLTPEE